MLSAIASATLILVSIVLHGQVLDTSHLAPCTHSDSTVQVHRLYDDSLCTSFVICIPRSVARHYHRYHTEHVMVLEGAGIIQLGDSTFSISAGTSIVIPKGTAHGVRTTSLTPLRVISVQSPRFDGTDRIFIEP